MNLLGPPEQTTHCAKCWNAHGVAAPVFEYLGFDYSLRKNLSVEMMNLHFFSHSYQACKAQAATRACPLKKKPTRGGVGFRG